MNYKSDLFALEFKKQECHAIVWNYLINQISKKANIVEFTVSKHGVLPEMIKPFEKQVKYYFISKHRWQNKQLFRTPMVHLEFDSNIYNYLVSVEYISQWRPPNPSDPALYFNDKCLLWTISHYDSVFVELSIEEKVEFEETFEDRVITHLTDKKIAPSRIEEKTVISMKNT